MTVLYQTICQIIECALSMLLSHTLRCLAVISSVLPNQPAWSEEGTRSSMESDLDGIGKFGGISEGQALVRLRGSCRSRTSCAGLEGDLGGVAKSVHLAHP